MKRTDFTFFCFLVVFSLFLFVSVDAKPYSAGDTVFVWADRVGPFNNPQEFYMFYKLPFCLPDRPLGRLEGLGESILGYELRKTAISLVYEVPTRLGMICDITLKPDESAKLIRAVENQFWFQFFIDELPIWGMVGELVKEGNVNQPYVYTHLHFDIEKNGDRIIHVNMTSENAVLIQEGGQLSFTYSVSWYDTNINYAHRFDQYLDKQFFEHQIHWFSLFNALMLVVFLLGLVGMIFLRTIRKDFLLGEEDLEDDMSDDSGWKLLHRDVFRAPPRLALFSALIGTGNQIAVTILLVLTFGILGANYYEMRGSILTAFIVWYILCSLIGGYSSGRLLTKYNGIGWKKTALIETFLLPFVLAVIICFMSIVARSKGAMSFIPFFTLLTVVALVTVIGFPLTFIGNLGRHWGGCNSKQVTNSIPRTIPLKLWYQQAWFTMLISGLLPFSAAFIEIYFIFTALWHYKFYYLYGFSLGIFVILMIVTMCVNIISTYFLLNNEDHRWQWHSFKTGASFGFYLFCYSLYYYNYRTNMSGFLQLVQFTGYSLIISICLGLLCGAVGYYASDRFVNRIYRDLKVE